MKPAAVLLFAAAAAAAQPIQLDLAMPAATFWPGAACGLTLDLANSGPAFPSAQLFVALDIGIGEYWFHPSWSHYPPALDWEETAVAAGAQIRKTILPEFAWPTGAGEFAGAAFIAAVLAAGELESNVAVVTFGWSETPPATATPTPPPGATATPTPTGAAATPTPTATPGQPVTERLSVSSSGVEGDGDSDYPSIGGAGPAVAFASSAVNLVPGDTNECGDIFLRDREGHITERLSVASDGSQASDESTGAAANGDAGLVAFVSWATNLIADDWNGWADVYLRDRTNGITERISISTAGAEANGESGHPAISTDGLTVALVSTASNLVAGDGNGVADVFVRDRGAGTTERASVGPGGVQADDESSGPSVSADGRFVVFSSWATNLVAGDTNGTEDVFVHDRQAGTTERVSVATGGAEADSYSLAPSVSADGQFVAFHSYATNLVAGDSNGVYDVFVRDRQAGTTERVSVGPGGAQANHQSTHPALDASGRYVAFGSFASNLVAGDTNGCMDIFVFDRLTRATERASVSTTGEEGDAQSGDLMGRALSISADGRVVVFHSHAANLVAGDANAACDVFARTRW